MTKRRRQEPPPINARLAFAEGRAFLRGADALGDVYVDKNDPDMHAPLAVLAAYGAEALLKCLLTLREKKCPPHHHLNDLFTLLAEPDRERVRDLWEQRCTASPIIRAFRAHVPGVPTTLPDTLRMVGGAFIGSRYIFEGKPRQEMLGLYEFGTSLAAHILEERPAWSEARLVEGQQFIQMAMVDPGTGSPARHPRRVEPLPRKEPTAERSAPTKEPE